jgi:uncharacterized membrane protein YkvI
MRYCVKVARKEQHSLIKAALNAADSLQVTVILITLLIEQRGRKIDFTKNELASLVISCVAAGVWMITRTGWIGFFGFQFVMCVAYLPTIESLWNWNLGPSPEPMEKWGINIVIASIGIIVDITDRHDYVAMVYPLRALVLCMIVVLLISRWQLKNKTGY